VDPCNAAHAVAVPAGGDLPGGPPGSSGAPEDPYNPDNSPGLFTIM
jgi:hypothetical protein